MNARKTVRPTEETYSQLQAAYDFFNVRLFEGKLPHVMLTLQRRKRTGGYFSPGRFAARATKTAAKKSLQKNGKVVRTTADELAMNPEHFGGENTEERVMSVLVHEMAHVWQQHLGKPGRGRYHNEEWAAKMDTLGLTPTSTGAPGGKRTGDHLDHMIVKAGPFQKAFLELKTKGFHLRWADAFGCQDGVRKPRKVKEEDAEEAEEKKQTRQKFTCPECGLNAWAKPDAALVCGECAEPLEAV